MIRYISSDFEASPARVVLVDHEAEFVESCSTELTAEGFICLGCTSLEAATAAVTIQPPDVLLVGVSLPGAGWLEVARRVRANSVLADLPVIFLSATQIPDIIHRCDDGHGCYSVRKSLDIGVLVELIERMLPAAVAVRQS